MKKKYYILLFAICTSHNTPCFPPRSMLNICFFYFSWVLQLSQEQLKTMLARIFGANKVYYGRCANGALIIYFGPELIPLYSLKNILIILFIPQIVLSMVPHTLNCFFQFSHNPKNPNTGHRSPSFNTGLNIADCWAVT